MLALNDRETERFPDEDDVLWPGIGGAPLAPPAEGAPAAAAAEDDGKLMLPLWTREYE